MTIASPQNDATLKLRSRITINLSSTNKYPLKKTELYVNDKYIGVNDTNPSAVSFTPTDLGLSIGKVAVRVVVYDSILNQGEASVTLNLEE